MNNCIFCKMINKEIKTEIIYEDEKIMIFKDINPQAPIHFLAIPKVHIESIDKINEQNSYFISHIFEIISKLKSKLGIEESFRVISNCGESAGQTVMHLHFHILSGRKFSWPPG